MLRNHIIYNGASNWKFDFAKASGVNIWDRKGKKILDFTSGWNVVNLGWNNKEIRDAMISQLKTNMYAPMETEDFAQKKLADLLTKSLPSNLTAVGRATGGMEANEEAIKTAKAFTGRKKILGFRHAYHGQSVSMMSLVLDNDEVASVGPNFPAIEQLEFPATFISNKPDTELLKQFENKLDKVLAREDIAAVMTEPGIITGWGSTYVAPSGFMKLVRKLTKKYSTLLILDEVGTGFSRCGKLYGMNIEDIEPDIATFAKGFSNGAAAIGAMVTTQKIAEKTWENTNLQSTFGWVPSGCAAALKNLEIHLRDKVWEKSYIDGEYMKSVLLNELKDIDNVGDIRGYGLEIGITFVKNKEKKIVDESLALKVADKAFSKGLYILYGDDGNIQLMPPLIISRSDLNKGIEILIDVIKYVK